jgi:hypothetical protein
VSVRKFSSASISSAAIKSSKLWDQETFPGTFESISTAIVDSNGASSIVFSNIPQNYTHLQIRATYFCTDVVKLQFNTDTGSNYNNHGIRGGGASASSYSVNSGSPFSHIQLGTSAPTSASYGQVQITDIIDYTSTSKAKTIRSLFGFDTNNTSFGQVELISGLWFVTPVAINSITIFSSNTIAQYSQFALYGIRGA